MLKLIKGSILNLIQASAEVNAALKENTLVVVTKDNIGANYEQSVYSIYAGKAKLVAGQIKED